MNGLPTLNYPPNMFREEKGIDEEAEFGGANVEKEDLDTEDEYKAIF